MQLKRSQGSIYMAADGIYCGLFDGICGACGIFDRPE